MPALLLKTKRPASVMSLGFIAPNGAVMPLIWFPSGHQLTTRKCEAKLADKLVPWINKIFDMSSVTAVIQQDGDPVHISNRVQHFLQEQTFFFWSKTCGLHSRQRPTHWTMPSDRILRPGCAMFVTQILPPLKPLEHPSTRNGWP